MTSFIRKNLNANDVRCELMHQIKSSGQGPRTAFEAARWRNIRQSKISLRTWHHLQSQFGEGLGLNCLILGRDAASSMTLEPTIAMLNATP